MKSAIALLAMLIAGHASGQQPQPPCTGAPVPAYPASPAVPVVQAVPVADWTPPACLGWDGSAPSLLVALAGRVHEAGGAAALLARFGAVSSLRGVRYWSVTDQGWRTLITDAFAVTDASARTKRADFRADEMTPDGPLYSSERDSRSSRPVIYRMRVLAATPDRVVVTVANATPLRAFLVTLFAPGDLQTTYFLDRLSGGDWGYYGMWGVTTGLLTSGHAASSINRAVALYRHFAGIPTDQDPPAAP